MDYEVALDELTQWALSVECVRALVLTGSGAAGAAHRLSDRDVEVFATAPKEILADESWWSRLGEVLVVERLENSDGNPTRLIYYVGGKFDFTVLPASALGSRNYDRPFGVLLDKDGKAAELTQAGNRWSPPSISEFDESINWAYAAALMCAKAIAREELWSAKLRDNDLKEQLLKMIEWDHHSRYGPNFDTRYLGTRMNQWMDSDVREALSACWGRFDPRDSMEALRMTLDLYAALAIRTADVLALPPPRGPSASPQGGRIHSRWCSGLTGAVGESVAGGARFDDGAAVCEAVDDGGPESGSAGRR